MSLKVVLLASLDNIHTIRWANGLASRNLKVHVISVHPVSKLFAINPKVAQHILKVKAPLGYIFSTFEIKKLIKKIQPDLVNAHYATGYGTLARLVNFQPTIISVWGSDVYDFPKKSFLHRALLRKNLRFATAIASTSNCMANETKKTHLHNKFFITPFGVDTNLFFPANKTKHNNDLVIGTVKTLHYKYGIDTLIEAFSMVKKRYQGKKNLKLEITGDGKLLKNLQIMVNKLGLNNEVKFYQAVSHNKVPDMLNRLDIYVALSRLDSESFGVAIIEASACAKPVVVSDADGLSEVTLAGKTGLIVAKNNPLEAANAIMKLINNDELRNSMGKEGRKHVLENYSWQKSLDLMIDAYQHVTNL